MKTRNHADASLGSCLGLLLNAPTKLPPRPVAVRRIIDHPAPCWHCSKRLQACYQDGSPNRKRSAWSPNYAGPVIAFIAEVDEFERRVHSRCADELGFRCVASASALPGASPLSAQTIAHPASAPDRSGERPEGRKSDGESPHNGRSGDDIGAADFLPER